jgi:hypothetical protein
MPRFANCEWHNLLESIGFPAAAIAAMIVVSLALLLGPLLGGVDVGPIKFPQMPPATGKLARVVGIALLAVVLVRIPICVRCRNVANPGFEQDRSDGGGPTVWAPINALGLVTIDSGTAKSGRRSARVQVTGRPSVAGWVQSVRVPKQTPMELSGWIKSDNVIVRPAAQVAEGALIKAEREIGNGPESWVWENIGRAGTYDWTHFVKRFNTKQNERLRISVQVGDNSGDASGIAWFDDLKLECVDE